MHHFFPEKLVLKATHFLAAITLRQGDKMNPILGLPIEPNHRMQSRKTQEETSRPRKSAKHQHRDHINEVLHDPYDPYDYEDSDGSILSFPSVPSEGSQDLTGFGSE